MKKISSLLIVGAVMLAMLALASPTFAREVETITGMGTCAKCALHETEKCQNVVQVEKDGKTVNYYLTGKASKEFHDNLCKAPQKVTVTGNVKEKDGKMTMAVKTIELAK